MSYSNQRRIRSRRKGFTLIELLVVIAIIGVLSSIVLASLSTARAKAQDAKRISEIHELKTAIEEYNNSNNGYPQIGTDNTTYNLSGLANPLALYMKTLPTENLGNVNYQYVRGGPNSYGILVTLQNGSQCKTGQNMDANWWATGNASYSLTPIPNCNF